MSENNGRSRIHIQKRIADADVTLNVFGNDPEETYALFVDFQAFVAGGRPLFRPSQAEREMANAKNLAAAREAAAPPAPAPPLPVPPAPPAPKAAAKPKSKAAAPVNAPICQQCGSDEAMELIRWNDKNTGEPRQAWKCQNCELWWKQR